MGIATGVHYPTPIHRQPAYSHLGQGLGSLPAAERSAAQVLSLPMYPELSDAQVERVVEALLRATDETIPVGPTGVRRSAAPLRRSRS
jgi:dTDP-4-amino-4,6-dideoxygalactose transaminase